jgi:hypothetical protein
MEWLKEFFTGFKDWLYEILIYIPQKLFDLFLEAILVVIKALPLPDFMTTYQIADYIHPDIMFFLSMSGLGTALPIIGTAYIFYFFRRILTLGIW